jgi:hypothetical protein
MPRRQEEREQREQQEQTAGELSDRAAESVGRRYDATKEIHIGDRANERPAGEPPGDDDEAEDGADDQADDEARGTGKN